MPPAPPSIFFPDRLNAEDSDASMGVTCGSVRGPGSLILPILVGFVVFSTSSKTQQTPRQSYGTQLRVFFTVRKQHTTTGETCWGQHSIRMKFTLISHWGAAPGPFLFWGFATPHPPLVKAINRLASCAWGDGSPSPWMGEELGRG